MRSKMLVLAVGVAGLLVVFALLAFVYTPHIVPTVAPVNAVAQPAQMDTSPALDEMAPVDAASDADLVSTSMQGGHHCNGDSFADSGY